MTAIARIYPKGWPREIKIGKGDRVDNPAWMPEPGEMAICEDCMYGQQPGCASPLLKANGGSGITVKHPQPTYTFFRDLHIVEYNGPPRACSGHRTAVAAYEENVADLCAPPALHLIRDSQ